jgi:hypothetical protein
LAISSTIHRASHGTKSKEHFRNLDSQGNPIGEITVQAVQQASRRNRKKQIGPYSIHDPINAHINDDVWSRNCDGAVQRSSAFESIDQVSGLYLGYAYGWNF